MAAQDTGIGWQLITAFVQQLSGKQDVAVTDDQHDLTITFHVTPLDQAENRSAPVGTDPALWRAMGS